MSDHDQIQDLDFDAQLRGLFQEAEQSMEDRSAAVRPSKVERRLAKPIEGGAAGTEEHLSAAYASLPQMLRPVLLGIQAAVRATGEQTILLQKIGEKLDQRAEALPAAPSALPDLTDGLRSLLDQKNGVNQKMFAALHEELKGYKDGFLLESVHKPIIRDLISLHDDLSSIHRQMQGAVQEAGATPGSMEAAMLDRLKIVVMNIEHNCWFLLEVLARLEVTPVTAGLSKHDKHTQRVMSVELAANSDEDGDIVRSLKPGFVWKGRIMRPEEVVIKKWREGSVPVAPAALSQK